MTIEFLLKCVVCCIDLSQICGVMFIAHEKRVCVVVSKKCHICQIWSPHHLPHIHHSYVTPINLKDLFKLKNANFVNLPVPDPDSNKSISRSDMYIDREDLTLNSLHTTLVFQAEDKGVACPPLSSGMTEVCSAAVLTLCCFFFVSGPLVVL